MKIEVWSDDPKPKEKVLRLRLRQCGDDKAILLAVDEDGERIVCLCTISPAGIDIHGACQRCGIATDGLGRPIGINQIPS